MKNKSISLKDRITKYVYNSNGWVHIIDHLAEGGTAEKFFKELK